MSRSVPLHHRSFPDGENGTCGRRTVPRTGTAFGASTHNESDIITTRTLAAQCSATQLIPTKGYRSRAVETEENRRSKNGLCAATEVYRHNDEKRCFGNVAGWDEAECVRRAQEERCNQSG